MQGTDLSVQVMGQIKPGLLLSRRPPWITILCVGAHQTRQRIWINLLKPCMCVAALGIRAVGYLDPQVNTVGNCHALFHVVCNFLWVATQVGYTLGLSSGSRRHAGQCRECGRAAQSSLRLECERGKLLNFSQENCLGKLV